MMDLSPPPEGPVIAPSRPAIIMPSRRIVTPAEARGIRTDPPIGAPLLGGFGASAGSGARSVTGLLRVVAGLANDEATDLVNVSTDRAAGDLLVTLNVLYGNPSAASTTLSGWTLLKSANVNLSGDNYTVCAHFRVADGTEAATYSFPGVLSGFTYLLRARHAIMGVQATPGNNWTVESTGGNPSAQSITISGLTGEVTVFAFGFNNDGITEFTTESPAFQHKTSSIDASGRGVVGASVYSKNPVNHTVDVGDNTYANALISGYLTPQY